MMWTGECWPRTHSLWNSVIRTLCLRQLGVYGSTAPHRGGRSRNLFSAKAPLLCDTRCDHRDTPLALPD